MGLTKTQIGIVAVVVLVAAMISVDQSRTNAALTREIGELRAETQQLALLRAENLRLTQTVAQLSRKPEPAPSTPAAVAPVAIAEPTVVVSGPRVALKQGSDSPYLARVKEFDQIAQRQVAVMNQEGKQLAEEHKVLLARSSDPSLTPEARAQAAADAALKMEMIRSRQREIQAFIEGTRNLMNEQLTLARTADEHAPLPEPPIVIRLLGSTPENALATYEKISGASIVRDPSLASLRGVIDVPAWFCAKPDALESLRLALRNQLNIELETTANGTLVARLGVPR